MFTLTAQDRHGVLINRGKLRVKENKISSCLDANYHKGLDNHGARTGVLEKPPHIPGPEDINNTVRASGRGSLTSQDRHGVMVGKGEQYGETEEGNAVKILRKLREEIGEKAFTEWGLGILDSLQSEEVLQQGVHGERIQRSEEERKLELDRGSQESAGVSEKDGMLKMRKQREFRYSPQGRRFPEQLHQELSCIMQELSYKGTSRERFLQSLWTASKGIRVLREALSTVQEAWASSGSKDAKWAYRIRRLTPLETFRLQGFPDSHHDNAKAAGVSDSQLYKQAGNAVTVNVVYEIAKRLG